MSSAHYVVGTEHRDLVNQKAAILKTKPSLFPWLSGGAAGTIC